MSGENQEFNNVLSDMGLEVEASEVQADPAPIEPKVEEEVKVEPKIEPTIEPKDDTPIEPAPDVKPIDEPIPESIERVPQHMSVKKHLKKKEKWESEKNSLVQEIEQLKASRIEPTAPKANDVPVDDIAKIAEKHGLDPEILQDLSEHLKGTMPSQDSLSTDDRQLLKGLQEQQTLKNADVEYIKSFDFHVIPLIEQDFPNADAKTVTEIKEQLKAEAFTEKHSSTPITTLYKALKSGFDKSQSAESSRPTQGLFKITPDNVKGITPDQVKAFTDEQKDEYFKVLLAR